MKSALFKCLVPLASIEVQERFIANGTKEEYLLPSELLERAATVSAQALSASLDVSRLTRSEVEAVRQFDVVLKWEALDLDVEAITGAQLVRACPEWAEIREAAGICLLALGFGRATWECSEA